MAQRESVTVSLTANELVWLERIATDKDEEEALQFAEMIRKRVEQQQKSQMKPSL